MNYRLMRAVTRIQDVQFTLFGGRWMGPPTLRLTTTGRRSGRARRVLLLYLVDELAGESAAGERLIVIASAGGAASDPDWCENLRVNPRAVVERGGRRAGTYGAVELEGAEREELFERMCEQWPHFAGYQRKAGRLIPVVALRAAAG